MSCIERHGIIKSINGNTLEVEIQSGSACQTCAVRSGCGLPELTRRLIPVVVSAPDHYHVGDTVIVTMNQKQGRTAVFLAFILPLLIMLAALFVTYALWKNENLSAILSLFVLIPYYLMLHIFRIPLKKRFLFKLKEE